MEKLTAQSEIFTRAVADIVTREELRKILRSKKQLRIKHGIDATSPDLHLGHAANLWKIRALQEEGHKAVVLLGDVTAQIGDPTGRTKARPVLSEKEIRKNAVSLEKQTGKILLRDPALLEVRRSSEWYDKLGVAGFLKLLSMATNARLLERDMFQKRMKAGEEIREHEVVYPILQGYDSVALESDLTVIGSDQLFNEHMGRHYQEKFGQRPQVIVALKILPGLDGREKMSKSLGNHIALNDSPRDKFGKAMRLPDPLLMSYLEAYTDVSLRDIREVEAGLKTGKNPMEAKLFWAGALVRRYHGAAAAKRERESFLRVFSQRELPENVQKMRVQHGSYDPAKLLAAVGLATSKSEARRLIRQGAVKVGGIVHTDPGRAVSVKEGTLIQVGRRKIFRVR